MKNSLITAFACPFQLAFLIFLLNYFGTWNGKNFNIGRLRNEQEILQGQVLAPRVPLFPTFFQKYFPFSRTRLSVRPGQHRSPGHQFEDRNRGPPVRALSQEPPLHEGPEVLHPVSGKRRRPLRMSRSSRSQWESQTFSSRRGRHSTEIAFVLLTQQPRVWIPAQSRFFSA